MSDFGDDFEAPTVEEMVEKPKRGSSLRGIDRPKRPKRFTNEHNEVTKPKRSRRVTITNP